MLQDIGLDGLDDSLEAGFGYNGPPEDPALDNYVYYLNREGGILERYLDFNNTQGNSPVAVTDTDRGNTTLPDVEDIDRDLTMNTVNSYYEYRIPIRPGISVDDRYVTDIREGLTTNLPNGSQLNYRWIQYKIPLSDFTDAIGGITDFRSISFMRMYLTGFQDPLGQGDTCRYPAQIHFLRREVHVPFDVIQEFFRPRTWTTNSY